MPIVSQSTVPCSRECTHNPNGMLRKAIREIARAVYVRAFRRRGVVVRINSRRYRVSSSIARGLPPRIDAPALRYWLEAVRGQKVAVDAGANVGIWSILAAREMPAGATILAIEPSPATFQILADCARVADGPATIIPFQGALGDHRGAARFIIDGPSSATNHLGTSSDEGKSVEVALVSLDEVLATRGLNPSVIKVDVEGAELLLLRGAGSTMRRLRPTVVLELHWGRELGSTPKAILQLAREYRYVLADENGDPVETADALLAQNFVIMRPADPAPRGRASAGSSPQRSV